MTFPSYCRQDVLYMMLVAIGYALLGKLVLVYFSTAGSVTLIWIPGGAALAVLLVKGLRLWPGVFAGAFITGLLVNDAYWLCFFIATGNTLETVLAAWCLQRKSTFSIDLAQPLDFYRLTLWGVICALISALFGPLALWRAGLLENTSLAATMAHWWMGDVFGIVTLTPLLLIWRHVPENWFDKARSLETVLFAGLSLLAALVVLLRFWQQLFGALPHVYWMYVFMFWAVMRFGRHGVQYVAAVTAITALMGVANGRGYFYADFEQTGLLNFWLFQTLFSAIGSGFALTLHNERRIYRRLAASEQRLQAMVTASPVAYALVDAEDNITLLNPAFVQLFGYSVNDIAKLSDLWVDRSVDPSGDNGATKAWRRLLLAGCNGSQSQPFEADVRCKHGEFRHVQVHAVPLRQAGDGGEYLVTLLDLTEQARAQSALSNTNVLLKSIVETLPLRVFWKDCESRFLGANGLFARDAGLQSVEELLGKDDRQLVWWKQAALYRHDDRQVMQSGEPRLNYEEPQTTPDGDMVWLRTSKLPLRNADQEIIGVLGMYEDITMRKCIEDQLMWRTTFLETLLDCSPDGILVVDKDGNKLVQNRRVGELWGIPDEIVDAPKDITQLEFVKHKLQDPQAFLDRVNFLYANPDVACRDEIQLKDGVILERYSAAVCDRLGHYYGRIWHFTNVTEVRNAQKALQRKEYYQRALLDNFPFAVWLKDKESRYLAVNKAFAEAFVVDVDSVFGKTDFDIFPADLAEHFRSDDLDVMQSRSQKNLDELVGLGNERCWMETCKAPLLDENAEVLGTVGFSRNISPRKAEEQALQMAALVFDNSSEAMMVTDIGNIILNVNAAFCEMTGYRREEVIGTDPKILTSGCRDGGYYAQLWRTIDTVGHWRGEIHFCRKSGEHFVAEISINTIFDVDDKPQRRVALFSDITQRKRTEDQIWRQANFDPLTGLPNRHMARGRLEQAIKESHRAQQRLGILMIDLDRFKEINDTLGHDIGDELLQQAAKRLESCVREADIVGRLGGDEFVVILHDVENADSPGYVANKLVEQLSQPFCLRDELAYVSASIGVTLYPDDGEEFSQLLRNADQAMYAAKSKGRNCFCFFTQCMQAELNERAALVSDLRGALDRREFKLLYQPIVELATGRVQKAEALLRWQHPKRGLVSPNVFVPAAEQTGLINAIGDWVFDAAVAQAEIWRKTLNADFQISINKSPLQFLDTRHNPGDWVNRMAALAIPGQALTVEITESLLLEAGSKTAEHLLTFRDAGIQVAIDDFGTGYSALAYLKKFDIDYLKIDQSFVSNLSPESSDFVLCEAIIVMAHKLGLKVIAEGVETELQRDLLASAGCDYGQGYLFAQPLPPDEFEGRFGGQGR